MTTVVVSDSEYYNGAVKWYLEQRGEMQVVTTMDNEPTGFLSLWS